VRRRFALVLAAVLATAGMLTACAAEPKAAATAPPPASVSESVAAATPSAGGTATAAPSLLPPVSPTPTPPATDPDATDPLAGMSLAQRVGQLFMVGTPVDRASRTALRAVRDRHAGGIFLAGRSTRAMDAVAGVTGRFTRLVNDASTADVPLWIATDQEGGAVQVLRGRGFSDIPYAIRQADARTAALQRSATRWGTQLRKAGVTMNLAPVADIVTSAAVRFDNAPIGALGRQYGYSERTVAAKAGAFAAGMRAAGVMPTFKHFPGLGRVTANTDTSRNVHDTVISARSPDVDVYRSLTAAGPSVVMVSSAVYDRIDPSQPAMFSSTVVEGVLREGVGFDGVVITDDVSAARAVTGIPPAKRAVRAIEAGVDVVLVSADASVFPEMYDAVLHRAEKDPDFAKRVDESARRVVLAKLDAPASSGR
jgi:beta-N-acetylhexosaminidase